MSDTADERSSGGSGATWVVSIVGVLVLYALSPAPVAKVLTVFYGRQPPPTVVEPFLLIYTPLFKSIEHVEPARRFYEWYFKLWNL
jgi:hypothetical protein